MTTQAQKILVTGGAGYLGNALCRRLLAQGHEIFCLDLCWFGESPIQDMLNSPRFHLIKDSIQNQQAYLSCLSELDTVIHLAGLVGDPACGVDPSFTNWNNYEATKNLLAVTKAYGVGRFVFASSCSVYGKSDDLLLTENSPTIPQSLYAEDKLRSEVALLAEGEDTFTVTALRLSTLCGVSPRMRLDLVANILGYRGAVQGKFTIFGGKQWRPFLHVLDAAKAFATVATAPADLVSGEIFNVGGERSNLTIEDLAKIVKEVSKASYNSEPLSGDMRDYNVDFTKIKHKLGFSCDYGMLETIEEIVSYGLANKGIDLGAKQYNNFTMTKELVTNMKSLNEKYQFN